jgi:hypothetical protein
MMIHFLDSQQERISWADEYTLSAQERTHITGLYKAPPCQLLTMTHEISTVHLNRERIFVLSELYSLI